MRNNLKGILLFGLAVQLSWAQLDYGFKFSKVGSAGFQFLKIDVGARESALGGAMTSITRDANSVFWNPAGIAQVRAPQCLVSGNNWLVESQLVATSLAYPFGSNVIAVSVLGFRIAEYEETTVLQSQGTGKMISAGDIQVGVALARRFTDRLSIGGQWKYAQESLDNYSFDNFMIDIGTIYRTGFRDLIMGFTFQHFGPDMQVADQKFRTPLLFRLGFSDIIFKTESQSILLSVDMVHPTDNIEFLNLGLEYSLAEILFLRYGYRHLRDVGDHAFGIGIRLPAVGAMMTHFDYSYMTYGDIFGNIHRLTIGISL